MASKTTSFKFRSRWVNVLNSADDEYSKRMKKNEDNVNTFQGLDLSCAGFRTLSPTLATFAFITDLNISRNNIALIPEDVIFFLAHLESVNISHNSLVEIPAAFGSLKRLTDLDVSSNQLLELPSEIGRLFGSLKHFEFYDNPITSPPYSILSGSLDGILRFLRENLTVGNHCERKWKVDTSVSRTAPIVHRILCYNVLADSYATEQMHPYCPQWALLWSHRRSLILQEILAHDCDLICLQEVEIKAYDEFFKPKLAKVGYSSVFKPKTRAATMDGDRRRKVDGVTIFFRRDRYDLVSVHEIDYNQVAMARAKSWNNECLTRLMTKDNVGLSIVVNDKYTNHSMVVCNTHLHWDPEQSDVKLLQTQFLLEDLDKIVNSNSNMSLLLCGDFNSEPGSAVHELLSNGNVRSNHEDLRGHKYGDYTWSGFWSNFHLESCCNVPYTNFTREFVGVLDYIFVDCKKLRPVQYMDVPQEDEVRREHAWPSILAPSDHLSLVCDFLEI